MKHQVIQTLNQFIIEKQAEHPKAKGEFSRLMHHIGIAAKIVSREVNKAGLEDILGQTQQTNIQGEVQQKLDLFADRNFIEAIKASREVCGIATEENQNMITFTNNSLDKNAKYIFLMDPLDGSSNIDVNVSIGTVFSIYRRTTPLGSGVTMDDFLQKGNQQVASGYILYGSSTMLVYTTGNGTNGFTLDPSIGEFCLSHPNIKTPDQGHIYSINEGNYTKFPQGIKNYIKYCQVNDSETNRPYSSRYIGSLVADFHRNLLKGGIFLYPQSVTYPNGKLRLLYECNPIAFLVEQSGGKATNGHQRIMDIQPTDLHQRVPFYVGSRKMVEKTEAFLREEQQGEIVY